jgi:hypothetical protein
MKARYFATSVLRRFCLVKKRVGIPDLPEVINDLIEQLLRENLTMVSRERLYATALSARNVCVNNISGDFVECGVWRGGNVILAAKVFEFYGVEKKYWLYDTFFGMTKPTEIDFSNFEGSANKTYDFYEKSNTRWCESSLHDVKENLARFNLDLRNFNFIIGDVLETLNSPSNVPDGICILRLDTDWYESTKIELNHLYDKVNLHGIIMFDDYGYWGGHRKAIDDFFIGLGLNPLMMYIDASGRIMQKVTTSGVNILK